MDCLFLSKTVRKSVWEIIKKIKSACFTCYIIAPLEPEYNILHTVNNHYIESTSQTISSDFWHLPGAKYSIIVSIPNNFRYYYSRTTTGMKLLFCTVCHPAVRQVKKRLLVCKKAKKCWKPSTRQAALSKTWRRPGPIVGYLMFIKSRYKPLIHVQQTIFFSTIIELNYHIKLWCHPHHSTTLWYHQT